MSILYMIVLGIETSCDETSAAIVTSQREIKSNCIWLQHAEHAPYGGVVPEFAARTHLEKLNPLIKQAMCEAQVSFNDLSGIAVTGGPGLIGGIMVGVMTAKAIAAARNLPFIAVNHLAGHALTARLTDNINCPYLMLLVSGGHCQILVVNAPHNYRLLGTTIDDAIGEAFDKVARLLSLPYPGGPSIEQQAQRGNPNQFKLPRPLLNRLDSCDFSFSGLKTAVRQIVHRLSPMSKDEVADMCASFQRCIGDILINRCKNAINNCDKDNINLKGLVFAGGVASNQYLRLRLSEFSAGYNLPFIAPPASLCTDNAAMIAWAGLESLQLGITSSLDFAPRPRWPLEAEIII